MWDQKYQKLLRGLLDFDLKVLNPWEDDTEQRKWTKLFRIFNFSHVALVSLLLTFAYFESDHLSFLVIMENVATALAVFRSVFYGWLVLRFHGDYKRQLDKMHDDRTQLPSNEGEKQLAEAFYRREFRIVLSAHIFIGISGLFLIHVFAFFCPNDYQLLFNCYIFFLPPDGFLFAWELNFLFMTIVACFVSFFFLCYLSLPLLLMNHTCWLLDLTLMTADQMNTDLQPDDDFNDQERIATTNGHLKEFLARCQKVVEWRNEVQDLLYWNFNLEFQIQAIILCVSIYVLSLDFTASYIVQNVFMICLVQLFIYCWMGTRVTNRIDLLSIEISKDWYLMQPKQRKVVQMILHWTQNMNEFTGTFKDVSLETFQSILEASYSFYTFLRSSRD